MSTRQQGFSLIELMMVMIIFVIVSGAVFLLLATSQERYRGEKEFLESFQGARLGVELMVRDIHNAGFPPPNTYSGNLGNPPTPGPASTPPNANYPQGVWALPTQAPAALQQRFAVGVLGVVGGVVSDTCTVNGGATPCTQPGPWDLVLELDTDPENNNPPRVEWMRYDLRLTTAGAAPFPPVSTLFRTVSLKTAGANPTLNPNTVPFVENIIRDPTLAVGALLTGGVTNTAVFTYECDPAYIIAAGPPAVCLARDVKNVYINLQVQSTRIDPRTGRHRQVTVQGAASRYNPPR